MTRPINRRLSRAFGALGFVAVVAVGTTLTSMAPASAGPITQAQCDTRVNDTPSKLVECIQTDALWQHMQNFQAIADANPGPDGHASRNSGEPGYRASVDYVANLMQQAGYDVTIQTYHFFYYAYLAPPVFQQVSPVATTYQVDSDYTAAQGQGSATAALEPAGGIVLPPSSSPSSSSGCTPADFTGFTAGHIALIQRGTCNFTEKILNAEAAGASGIVIFNEGQPGRTDLLNIDMHRTDGTLVVPTVPVVFATYDVGNALYQEYKSGTAPTIHLDEQALIDPNREDYNVIADSKGGNKNHVLVVDAHLDAIYGAGMLDNASGSTTILETALKMKNVNPLNKVRFIWFGGEELGLYGSQYYVDNLSSTDLSHIGYDLDADVTATPNYTVGVLDPAAPPASFAGQTGATFPNRVYKASTVARDFAINYFDSMGLNHELFSPEGTDAITFNKVGVPASGLLTGQDCCKTQQEVDLFGGQVGNFEGNIGTSDGGCVDNAFRWCDNLDNNDPNVLTFMSKAFADMTIRMAFDNKIMTSSNNYVSKPKLPITQEVGKHSVSS